MKNTVVLFEYEWQKSIIIKIFKKGIESLLYNARPGCGEYYGINSDGDIIFTRNPEGKIVLLIERE